MLDIMFEVPTAGAPDPRGRDQRGDDSEGPAADPHVPEGRGRRREVGVVSFIRSTEGFACDADWVAWIVRIVGARTRSCGRVDVGALAAAAVLIGCHAVLDASRWGSGAVAHGGQRRAVTQRRPPARPETTARGGRAGARGTPGRADCRAPGGVGRARGRQRQRGRRDAVDTSDDDGPAVRQRLTLAAQEVNRSREGGRAARPTAPGRDRPGSEVNRSATGRYLASRRRGGATIRAVACLIATTRKRGPRRVPLLPLRDIVVFPHMVVPLFVGREKSISALEEAMGKGAAGGEGDLPLRAAQGEDQRADPRGHLHRSGRSARSSSCCACPTAP